MLKTSSEELHDLCNGVEAADILEVSRGRVSQFVREGALVPVIRRPGVTLFDRAELVAFAEERRRRRDARLARAAAATNLHERLSRWTAAVLSSVTDAEPDMPAGIEDRNADVWEALLAVADAAGGDWPARARAAAQYLVAEAQESTPSLGVRLLADLRMIFGDRRAMSTEAILAALNGLEESPWPDLRGKPLNARGLANRLRPYGVRSVNVRIEGHVLKGYLREDLHDAWSRYCP